MNPVTQTEIKNLTGLSRQFVSKECAKGRLTLCMSNGKKMVDLDGHLTVEWLKLKSFKGQEKPPQIPIEDKIDPSLFNDSGASSISDSRNPSGLPGSESSQDLKDTKLEEQIEELRIKNQQKRGDLIEKELIKKLFGKMYEIDQNQFKTINVSITPKISAAYNTANTIKSNEIIELVKSTIEINPNKLKNLQSEINKTLEAGEPDRILEMNKILEDATGSILENIQRSIDDFINMIEEKVE